MLRDSKGAGCDIMWASLLLALHIHLDAVAKRIYGVPNVQIWDLERDGNSDLHEKQ